MPAFRSRIKPPTSVTATASAESYIDVYWPAIPASGQPLAALNLYRNGVLLAQLSASARSYSDTTAIGGLSYSYAVSCVSTRGAQSSQTHSVTTWRWTVPTGLTATAVSASQINLAWNAVTGATSYRVYRGGALVQTVSAPTTSWNNTGLTASTLYSYTVAAVDGAGNASAQSTAASATTNSVPSGDGAVISGSVLTIDRSAGGFGTKATVPPYRFFPLQSDANGTDCRYIAGLKPDGSSVGMEQYNLDYGDRWTTVQTGENVWGKDLVYTVTSDGMTPGMGSLLSPNVNLVCGSFWMKITRSVTTSAQWKGPRGGSGSSTNGNVNYGASGIKFHHELYCTSAGVFDDVYPGWNNSGNVTFQGSNEIDGPASFRAGTNMFSQWHCWQFLNSSGTAGASDGFSYLWCDGAMVVKKTNLAVTLNGSTALQQHQQFITGLQNLNMGTYSIRSSRPYVDTTRARVELINASTYANATGFLIMRPTVWTDTHIEVPNVYCLSIPSGYNWCAVTNAAGTTTVIPVS